MADLPAVVIHPDAVLPVPSQRTQLARATLGTKIKKVLTAIVATVIVAAISFAIGEVFWGWMAYVGYAFAALIFFLLIKGALTGMVAPCPYCGAVLGEEAGEDDLVVQDEAQAIWCKACGEYVTLEKGELRAHDPKAIAEEPTFKSYVFKGGVWPAACVLCGNQPTRRDELSTTDLNGAALLIGRISVSTGSVKGVPYCDAHQGAVKLSISDDKLQLTWRSLPMLRQYVRTNRAAGNVPFEKD